MDIINLGQVDGLSPLQHHSRMRTTTCWPSRTRRWRQSHGVSGSSGHTGPTRRPRPRCLANYEPEECRHGAHVYRVRPFAPALGSRHDRGPAAGGRQPRQRALPSPVHRDRWGGSGRLDLGPGPAGWLLSCVGEPLTANPAVVTSCVRKSGPAWFNSSTTRTPASPSGPIRMSCRHRMDEPGTRSMGCTHQDRPAHSWRTRRRQPTDSNGE
jgi:hypothetical protein